MDRKASERLFQGLQEFVNLGDSIAEFWSFSEQWPDFFPVSFHHCHEPTETFAWSENSHRLVLAIRDILRAVWQTGSKRTLALLLGVGSDVQNLINTSFVYNFGNPFSGTHFGAPRQFSGRLRFTFR